MIGIRFELNVTWDNALKDLLNNINYKEYNWYFREQEIYFNIKDKSKFLKKTSGELLESIIQSKEKYLILKANIEVFKKESLIVDIKNQYNLINSNCELIILIENTTHYEIYFNDEKLKNTIINNLDRLNVKYDTITLYNDLRREFVLGD